MPDEFAEQARNTQQRINDARWGKDGPTYYMGKPVRDVPAFWSNVMKRVHIGRRRLDATYGGTNMDWFCCRCGEVVPCHHVSCDVIEDPDHAERIRARYAFGKRYNPDHDEAIYTDPPL